MSKLKELAINFPPSVVEIFAEEEAAFKALAEDIQKKRSARAEVYLALNDIPRAEWKDYRFTQGFKGLEKHLPEAGEKAE